MQSTKNRYGERKKNICSQTSRNPRNNKKDPCSATRNEKLKRESHSKDEIDRKTEMEKS